MACLRRPAHWRANLSHSITPLRQFRQIPAQVRMIEGDASCIAPALRRGIAMLLLAERDVEQAEAELVSLHEGLLVLYGPDRRKS